MKLKKLHHICIQTESYKESKEFYINILGFNLVSETSNFHTRDFNTWLELDGFMIELQTPKKGNTLNKWSNLNEGPVHLAFMVDSVEDTYNEFLEKKYNNFKLKNGKAVYEVLGGKLLKVKAPEGTEIEIRDTEI